MRPLLALSLRSVLLEAFKLPSSSMFPTLSPGDHVFLNKLAYTPLGDAPERGDLVVFEFTESDLATADYIKRIVALPGDVVEVKETRLWLNGELVLRCPLGTWQGEEDFDVAVEFLGSRAFLIALDRGFSTEPNWGPFSVPLGNVFVLGDNRDRSHDSRRWRNGTGAGLPLEQLRGRVVYRWLPLKALGGLSASNPRLPDELTHLQPALDSCLAQGTRGN